MTFMLPEKQTHIKVISGFRGVNLGLPERLGISTFSVKKLLLFIC